MEIIDSAVRQGTVWGPTMCAVVTDKINSINSRTYTMIGPDVEIKSLYKNGEKNLRFCESVHTDPHKNATKTEVFENAVKSGYPQKRRFLKTHLINVNAQKRRFLKTLQYPTLSFTKTE